MTKVLIVAEHAGDKLNAATAKCVTAAAALGGEIAVAVFAAPGSRVPAQAAQIAGGARGIEVAHASPDYPLAATVAPHLVEICEPFSHVFGPSTTFGKDLMPRVAAMLDAPQVSDVMAIESATRFRRPIYAGNAITTVEISGGGKIVATIRIASFDAAAGGGNAPVEPVSPKAALPSHTRFVNLTAGGGDRPDLQSASRVVSGGRAVGSADSLKVDY
jgi:electron transfer flavoprotein alpha subunit